MVEREIFWNIPGGPPRMAFYLFMTLTAGWAAYWFYKRSRRWKKGRPDQVASKSSEGMKKLAEYVLTHKEIRRDPYSGWMHMLIFWGFVILLIATTLVAVQHDFGVKFLTGNFYLGFSLISDLGGVAFCVGIAMALWRRSRPSRVLKLKSTSAILWLMLILGITGFMVEGARIAHDFPSFEVFSPVGWLFAHSMSATGAGGAAAPDWHRFFWVLHAVLAGAFFVAVPLTIMRHIVTAPYSVSRKDKRPGALTSPAEAVLDSVDKRDFSITDLAQADACLTCGRCTEGCPATAAGKPLNPRSIILGLRAHLDADEPPLTATVDDDSLWSCTTCNACDENCPVDIQIVDKIVQLRRGRVAAEALPTTAATAAESIAQKYNPYEKPNSARMEWAQGLKVPVLGEEDESEVLYWIGCSGAFDPEGKPVARSMVKILEKLGVTYSVLGKRECCTGDPARRMGDEGLFQELAEHNRSLFKKHGVKTILTHCAHCYNSLKNEYPEQGPTPDVIHHTQFLREKIEAGELELGQVTEEITFHDPCYLARANDETEAPRKILGSMCNGNFKELERHGKKGFCCGGGGGQLWLDVRGETRVEQIRATEIEESGAKTVATGCPFCRTMLKAGRDGLEEGQGSWQIKDLAQLVEENLAREEASQ